jgi:DNA-binding transcriptional LysR family regulator
MTLIHAMDINHVDLPALRCFVALMDERNVSRAANRLELSQPAISHTLGRLRQLFDDPLLVRARGAMAPTSRALELDPVIRNILADVDHLMKSEKAFAPRTMRARFVLTATEYLELMLVPSLIERLQREAPGVDVEVRTPNREMAASWLASGQIDFRMGWVRDPPASLYSRLLFRDRLVCLLRHGHPTVHGSLTPEQYLEVPHVRSQVAGKTTIGRLIDETMATLKKKVRLSLLVQDYLIIPYTVARSDLIATVPERLGKRFADQLPLQILPFPFKVPRLAFSVYWHERTHRDPGHRWFRQVLADVAKSL